MSEYLKYLDPKTLTKITRLDLLARLVVEGYVSGLHRSPYHGFSVEFAEHREYVPGDDIRHVDWRVFARSDRYYIKQYEEETNLRCTMLLDVSESMKYGSGEVSKKDYGCYLAASLAYLLLQQQDSVGLATFDNELRRFIPCKSTSGHLRVLLEEMGKAGTERKTRMDRVFHDVAERIDRRGMVVVISDLFDDPERVMMGLRHLRHNKHEVIVFHIMDEYELTFPFDDMTLFEGLEETGEVTTEPRSLRDTYLEEVAKFVSTMKKGCRQHGIDYVQISTDQHLDVALSAYLAARSSKGR